MSPRHVSKKERQRVLLEKIQADPFFTDEELAENFGVSIQTIRLDRLELGIPELRERTKMVAQQLHARVKSMASTELVGELLDIELGKGGLSILEIKEEMAFRKTKIARGHHLFAQANTLALAVIDADMAVTGVANVKYKYPVYAGEKVIAKAEVIRQRGNKYFVWVKSRVKQREVFRGKFIMVSLEENPVREV